MYVKAMKTGARFARIRLVKFIVDDVSESPDSNEFVATGPVSAELIVSGADSEELVNTGPDSKDSVVEFTMV